MTTVSSSFPAFSKTVYKRILPPSCIAFSSKGGKEIFGSALRHHGLKSFFALMEQHTTQSEPSFCGISTLVVALNAFSIDPKQSWKGPWRWYHEDILNCCLDLQEVRETGISLPDFSCLAICQGLSVDLRYADSPDGSLDEFRTAVKKACLEDAAIDVVTKEETMKGIDKEHLSETNELVEDETEPVLRDILVVSYNRKVLEQTGSGHFSPLAAYDPASDSVLILDTARFKYGAHWVPLPLLHSAMIPQDPSTGRSRGFALLSLPAEENQNVHDKWPVSILFRYRLSKEAREHQMNFRKFLVSLDDDSSRITWDKVLNYLTRDGDDSSFVWNIVEPQFKPSDAETATIVNEVIGVIQKLVSVFTFKQSKEDASLVSENSCEGKCRPNHSRTLSLRPVDAIFVLFLSVLDEKERRKQVTSAVQAAGRTMGQSEERLLVIANQVEKFIKLTSTNESNFFQ